MAKHRRRRVAATRGGPRRRAAAFRGGTLAVTIALCPAGSFKLFASASTASGGGHVASIGRSRHPNLHPPGGRPRRRPLGRRAGAPGGDPLLAAPTPPP